MSLTGTISREPYDEDAPAMYHGHSGTILHLNRPISLRAVPGDEINEDAPGVREVQLWSADRFRLLRGKVPRSQQFVVTGTLRHRVRTVELRTITMDILSLKHAGVRPISSCAPRSLKK